MNSHQYHSHNPSGLLQGGRISATQKVRLKVWGMGLLFAAAGASCGGGSGGTQGGATNPVGTYGSIGSGQRYFTDNNENGRANSLLIENMFWGRMVDVYGLDPTGDRVLMHESLVIGKGVQTVGNDLELRTNAVTAIQELIIKRNVEDFSPGGGFAQFEEFLRNSQRSLDPITQQGPVNGTGGTAGLFTMVPRNATIVLEFNDLLDPETINGFNVRILTNPDFSGTYEARIFPDPNFGDLADLDGQPGLEYYSTRVIIDPTISILESFDFNPPVPVNSAGFPPSSSVALANLMVMVPTKVYNLSGQTSVLMNPSGHALSSTANGAYDPTRPTQPILRVMRSGGRTPVTGDTYNGFLLDNTSPTLIGSIAASIPEAPMLVPGTLNEFLLPRFVFESSYCAKTPLRDDVLAQLSQGVFADVISSQGLVGSEVNNMLVRLRQYPSAWDEPGRGGASEWIQTAVGNVDFQTAYSPANDAGREICFMRINPLPAGYPNFPYAGIFPSSNFEVRFSEPMDVSSVTAFDSLLVTRDPLNPENDPPLASSSFVVGSVALASDLQRVSFTPTVDLSHVQGETEEYYINILSGALGATDLAGNELGSTFPGVAFQLDEDSLSVDTGGRVSRFTQPDEEPEDPFGAEPDWGNYREWAGQHLFDLSRQLIFPRPVSRFTTVADRTQLIPSLMAPFSNGIQTPLSNLGSKLQTLYRHIDLGWTLKDQTFANIDVIGMSWAPVNGLVTFDTFSQFEMRLSHSRYAPDETISAATLWPQYPNSGLSQVYNTSLLNGMSDPQKVMHERSRGYVVDPGLVFTSGGSLTKFMPFPMNKDLDQGEDERTYTWRDTSILDRAGPSNGGAPPDVWANALGLNPAADVYTTGQIRTIGLPLLVEFRCFADTAASGLNGFDINLAAQSSSQPYFRAFSTGGIDSSNNVRIVNP